MLHVALDPRPDAMHLSATAAFPAECNRYSATEARAIRGVPTEGWGVLLLCPILCPVAAWMRLFLLQHRSEKPA